MSEECRYVVTVVATVLVFVTAPVWFVPYMLYKAVRFAIEELYDILWK